MSRQDLKRTPAGMHPSARTGRRTEVCEVQVFTFRVHASFLTHPGRNISMDDIGITSHDLDKDFQATDICTVLVQALVTVAVDLSVTEA